MTVTLKHVVIKWSRRQGAGCLSGPHRTDREPWLGRCVSCDSLCHDGTGQDEPRSVQPDSAGETVICHGTIA